MTVAPDDVVLADGLSARSAEEADLEAIHLVETLGQPAPWSLGVIANELEVEWSTIWVVEDQSGRIVAFLCFWVVSDEIHILNVVVHSDARRRGVARALVDGLIVTAQRLPMTLITLEVRAGNIAAQELYRGVGFREIGRRGKYYSDNGEDAIVMARILEERPASHS